MEWNPGETTESVDAGGTLVDGIPLVYTVSGVEMYIMVVGNFGIDLVVN